MMTLVFLILGLSLLLVGANYLVDSSVAIAKKAKISNFIIGLTIVGMGTSAPEMFVSVSSALKGLGDMSAGNVVGSNIANIMLILGITAVISPFAITRPNLRRDIPITAAASLLMGIMSFDMLLSGAQSNEISRIEGAIMLLCFAAFMIYSFRSSRQEEADEEESKPGILERQHVIIPIIVAPLSLALLIFGGQLFLDSAIEIAKLWGMSDSVISITIVAVGTSLPELVTCIIAATKGNSQLALGNALGSNIFNILFVLGTAATIQPLGINGVDIVDFSIMILSALTLVVFSFTLRRNVIDRWEGAIFVAGYIGYISHLLMK